MVLKIVRRLPPMPCACCGQLYTEAQREKTVVDAASFLARPYALCPVCLQKVPEMLVEDLEYRRKARVEMFKRYNVVVRATWTPNYNEPPVEMEPPPPPKKKKG